jgi:Protein of unknown function (DUF3040)
MSLNYRQQRQLQRIESLLLRSDPQLAAMLAMFGRLAAGQRMPAREQAATRLDRIRQASALIAKAVAAMSAAIDLLVSAVLALFTALIMGSRAQRAQPTRQQANPGTNGR